MDSPLLKETLSREVLDLLPDAIFIHDARTWRLLHANRAALEMLDCSVKEPIEAAGPDTSPGTPPCGRRQATEWMKRAYESGRRCLMWRSTRKDGAPLRAEVTLSGVERNGVQYVVAVARETPGNEELEGHLGRGKARYQGLFDNIDLGIAVYEPDDNGEDFVFVDFNPAAERIEGIKKEDVIGKRLLEVFPEAREFGLLQVLRHTWETGSPCHHPAAHYRDGRIKGQRDNYVFKLPSGEVVAAYRDVTSQKRAEEALKKSEATLKSILRTAPVAIFLLKDRIFKWVSPRMEELTGYSERELLGRNTRMLYASESAFKEAGEAYKQTFYSLVGEVKVVWKRKDGTLIDVLLRGSPLSSSDRSEGYIITALDISDIKRAEQQRIELERQIQHVQKLESLGILAGGIAHDFNNLLMGILGHADLAFLELPAHSPVRKHLHAIEDASRQAAELCRQMLAYSGKGRFVVQKVDLSGIVGDMAQMLRISISKKAALRLDLKRDLPPVEADATQIRQVIMNLVINASEALEDKDGTISLSTSVMNVDRTYLKEAYLDEGLPEGRYCCIEVSDTGCGMDEETRARIFDPFFTTKFTGRGLGMAAVLGIVRGHGGAIKVCSEPGRGTTIKVLFPAVTGRSDQVAGTGEEADGWSGSGGVLLVDDESTVLEVGGKMLKHLGFSVQTARDGKEALEIFKKDPGRFACVILDLTMPRLDGEQTFLEIRRISPDTPVIISSGYNEQEITQRFTGKALTGFIQKPYDLNALKKALKSAVDR